MIDNEDDNDDDDTADRCIRISKVASNLSFIFMPFHKIFTLHKRTSVAFDYIINISLH